MAKARSLRWVLLVVGCLAAIMLSGCQIDYQSAVVLFVGHGEPVTCERGFEDVYFPDGSTLGPNGANVDVPPSEQNCEWAALFSEIAKAFAYCYGGGDYNGNGIKHEVAPFPRGDVPPFFTWTNYKQMVALEYATIGNYSPHVQTYVDLFNKVKPTLSLLNKYVGAELCFMDERPYIQDKMYEIINNTSYDKIVVVPLLMSESDHTREIREIITEWAEASPRPLEIVWGHPFFPEPYVRNLHAAAVVNRVQTIRAQIPAGVPDSEIGLLMANHGDWSPPPYPEFGWVEGDPFSYVRLMEPDFAAEIGRQVPYDTVWANNEFSPPWIPQTIAKFVAEGKKHIIVVPANFPSTCLHTMWDIPTKAVGRAVLPSEGIISVTRPDGAKVWLTARGYSETEPGTTYVVDGMRYCAEVGLMVLFEKHRAEYEYLLQSVVVQ